MILPTPAGIELRFTNTYCLETPPRSPGSEGAFRNTPQPVAGISFEIEWWNAASPGAQSAGNSSRWSRPAGQNRKTHGSSVRITAGAAGDYRKRLHTEYLSPFYSAARAASRCCFYRRVCVRSQRWPIFKSVALHTKRRKEIEREKNGNNARSRLC